MSITFFPGTGEHDDRPDLNVNQGNGQALLEVLGLWQGEDSMAGSLAARDFAARILTAQALLHLSSDDEGLPAWQEGNWYHGGRRAGYLAERLEILATVARWAAAGSAPVCWG